MKITKIDCIPLSVPTPMRGANTSASVLFVKLQTDEGLAGYAEAALPKYITRGKSIISIP